METKGYKLVRVSDDYPFPFKVTAWGHKLAFEHRVVMEQLIGRCLVEGEVVHHVDENPANNAPDNLRLFSSQAEHMRECHSCRGGVLTLPGFDSSVITL